MSERILKALMQLFAIIAKVDDLDDKDAGGGRRIVELFLKKQLNQELVQEYAQLYDEFLEAHHKTSKRKDGSKKRTSLNSVKVLRICTQINEELTQRQKIIVLIRLLEFINANSDVTEQENEFVTTVAETFNIGDDEFQRSKAFIMGTIDDFVDSPFWLYIDNQPSVDYQEAKHIYSEGVSSQIRVLSITSVNIFVIRYFGTHELYLNGQVISNDRNYILTNGSSLRSAKVSPIYYSDIISTYMNDHADAKLVFRTDNITYHFKSGKLGLHNLSFAEESGKLIGIMGGSGAGKSTLLNVLNGNYTPSQGAVTINGIDIHHDSDSIEGVIGFISQDDLLIEELTVFQNLFYNAKLCFDSMNDAQVAKLVLRVLNQLGLYETRDLKVGSPLDKTISGGQRKRLNIALELIREPSVLFVDEPTSGLSSRDSENIMDLQKELALKGKLIFVVIHQPSSDIFKMFDKLLILDQGGYPIYYGNPVDAVIYFKKMVNHVNADESECFTCGNVNPEQIFNIIESKVVDEYGNLTQNRKVSPKEWNKAYKEKIETQAEEVEDVTDVPPSTFRIPNKLKQFMVFSTRDVLSKLTNTQYMIVNMLEAPLLASILAFFVKFYKADNEAGYIFRENDNLPQYLFMSVVVALFIGLTVSAEEIIRDQKILKRESFLNLSKGSYLWSKISIMFTLSAIQTLLFVLVGNLILEIRGMTMEYWLIMFSASCFANMLGLNISASFNSAKVIYILIPFLIIPQLLFSGVIVKFDKLIPSFSSQSSVPWIGNIMASRWAYEALAVTQFKDNAFERDFYNYDKWMKSYNWKKNFWLKEISNRVKTCERLLDNPDERQTLEDNLLLLRNEFTKEKTLISDLNIDFVNDLTIDRVTTNTFTEVKNRVEILKSYYIREYNKISDEREAVTNKLQHDSISTVEFRLRQDNYRNESLADFVTNTNDFNVIVEYEHEFVQKSNPVYLDPHHANVITAHFYAPRKKVFGVWMDTFWANILVLWMMSLFLVVTLYFDALKRAINFLGNLGEIGSVIKGWFSPKKKDKKPV